ncbi:uncharacterized protein LOC132757274 [Ruditapes philippinarum]|uniref:uncharacterized protein LOC132757274 n=1 Tax=Ruditapes philippinarum TaxID=129788 RepID=UPI00295AAB07|nr:uncharacterized protein LOC132757274 [Ruditapes philippinarum]
MGNMEKLGLNPRQYTCNDTRRAINFDTYYTCECPTSWEGPYCEQDVDECARGFCEAWKVCDNKIGSYDCYCKTTDIICKLSLEVWEFALIVTAIGVVLLFVAGLLIYRKMKLKKEAVDNKKILGPSNRRFAKVSPMYSGEDDADHISNAPPMSAFISHNLHADVHKVNIDETDSDLTASEDATVQEEDLYIRGTLTEEDTAGTSIQPVSPKDLVIAESSKEPESPDDLDFEGMSKQPVCMEDLDIERTSLSSISEDAASEQQSNILFVQPVPEFNFFELAAELKRKREEVEANPKRKKEIMEHPPPELNPTHATPKFQKRKAGPKSEPSFAKTKKAKTNKQKQLGHTNSGQDANDDTGGEAERKSSVKHTH